MTRNTDTVGVDRSPDEAIQQENRGPWRPGRVRRSSRVVEWFVPSTLFALLAITQLWRLATATQALHRLVALGAVAMWIGLFGAVQHRPPARARERSPLAVAAALGASVATVPIGAAVFTPSHVRLVTAAGLLVVGSAVVLWSIATLREHFGVLPDARGVVTSGPYRIVRHPMYFGELVNLAGLVVAADRWLVPLVAWVTLVGVQLVRVAYEERLLVGAFAEYRHYCADVRHRIVPGVV